MPTLLVAKSDGTLLLKVDLSRRRVVSIGRSPRCDLTLVSPSVSRRHALLFRHSDGWRLVDTGSRSGLMTEAGRVSKVEMDERTWCRVGHIHLWLDPTGHAPQVPFMPDMEEDRLLVDPDGGEGPLLTVLDPGDRPLRRIGLRAHAAILVGTSPTCDVVVRDRHAAAIHVIIYREQTRWCVADAGGGEEALLIVDGRRSRRQRLHGGAVIRVGSHRLVISAALPRPEETAGEDDSDASGLHGAAPGEGEGELGAGADGGRLSAFLDG